MDKRLILHHTTGLRAGVHEIVGVLSGSPDVACPLSLHYGPADAPLTAQHVRTAPRFVLYREWAQAPVGSFNDFNPAQV
mgnify:CR=1 FL=1